MQFPRILKHSECNLPFPGEFSYTGRKFFKGDKIIQVIIWVDVNIIASIHADEKDEYIYFDAELKPRYCAAVRKDGQNRI